jgi:hypothetical protein
VEEVDNLSCSSPSKKSEYLVNFTDNSPKQNHESVEEQLLDEVGGERYSRRNLEQIGVSIVDHAGNLSKKINLQGSPPPSSPNSNSFDVLYDREIMTRDNKMDVNIPDDDLNLLI